MRDLLGFLLSYVGSREECSSGIVLLGSVRPNLDKKEPPLEVTHCWDVSLRQPLKDTSLLTSHRSCNDEDTLVCQGTG